MSRVIFAVTPLPELDPSTQDTYGGRELNVTPAEREQIAQEWDGASVPETHRFYRFVCTLEQGYSRTDAANDSADVLALSLAQRTSGLHRQQVPHNVRLFFAHACEGGAELWAQTDLLSRASPYLKDLLASDFVESLDKDATLPVPVYAKSVYRLAHLLEPKRLPDLAHLPLSRYRALQRYFVCVCRSESRGPRICEGELGRDQGNEGLEAADGQGGAR
ncbi:hypothetical protein JCM11641_006232 [Rhodosporidiobolus odoratus]